MEYTLVGQEDGSANLTVVIPGSKPLTCHSSHPNYETILAGVLEGNEQVGDLFDIAETAGSKFQRLTERIYAANGRLYFDGDEVDNSLAQQVVRFLKEGVDDWKPLVAFFENVMANPNDHSRTQLYDWIQSQNLSLTPDGMMIGYKGVNKDSDGNLFSCHAGTAIVDGEFVNGPVPNKIGSTVEMPRTSVMHNPQRDCDAGLHVGSYSYAKDYGQVLIEVHVNPRDVVSVPDSSFKMRCCRYKVIGILDAPEYQDAVVSESKVTKPKPKPKIKPNKRREVKEVRVGDVYEDTDKRRSGRMLKVKDIDVVAKGIARVEDTNGKLSAIQTERLQSRKYKLVKRGRKK